MNVYIQTDIEGIAGWCFFENRKEHTQENWHHRERMRRLLTAEVNAAVIGAFDAGADTVVVNDSHGTGYNILFEDLDPRCEIVHGRNFSATHWLPELTNGDVDALVLIGMHAMAGTRNSICPHSCWEVNAGEIFLSEASMAAAIAGVHDIPTVCISGDDKVCAEVSQKIPEIEAVQVKKALGAFQARSLIPARAAELITAGVRRGVERRDEIAPYKIAGAIRLNLLDSDTHAPPLKRQRSEDMVADDIETAFLRFEAEMPWTKFPVELPDGYLYPPQ